MSWKYGLVRHDSPGYPDDVWYQVHEMYDQNDSVFSSWTESAAEAGSETPEGVVKVLKMMIDCIEKEIEDKSHVWPLYGEE